MKQTGAKTISEKILSNKSKLDAYAGDIVEAEVDYVMVNDITAPLAFKEFEALGREIHQEKIVLVPDHFVPNKDIASAEQAAEMRRFAKRWKIGNYYEVGRGGVCHQVMVDEGFVAPGRLIIGADSHTCTYGALNAFATGVGSTEAAAVFAEGKLWFKVPESIKVWLEGAMRKYVSGKDLIIKLITDIGVDGANYKTLEFGGKGLANLPVSDRLTVSNMAIEAVVRRASSRRTRTRCISFASTPRANGRRWTQTRRRAISTPAITRWTTWCRWWRCPISRRMGSR